MRKITSLLSLILIPGFLIAQSFESTPRRPFQFTFLVPPFSTSGTQAGDYLFGASLNPFIGYTGGVEGVELAGFMNVNRYSVRGFQASGFMNITGVGAGDSLRHSAGIQCAGFGNIVNGDFTGIQLAGFGNFNEGSSTGLACAGFMNVAGTSDRGIQLAGFTNIMPQGMSFTQVSGFMNVAGFVYGVQSSGFINVSREIKGVQTSGFANIATEGVVYAQAGGFINVAPDVNGVQVAGFINVAEHVRGVQVSGFINVCDSMDGIALGFINIVKKNGYRHFSVSANEYSPLRVSYRMGVAHFYNTYTLSKLFGSPNRWTFGAGLGTFQPLSEKVGVDLELSAHQELWLLESKAYRYMDIDRLNMVNTLRVSLNYELMEHLTLFLGPTLNIRVSNHSDYVDNLGEDIHPIWVGNNGNAGNFNTTVGFWPGVELGVVF